MKKVSLLLALALLLTLTACRKKEPETPAPPTPPESVEEEPLRMEELTVEFPRNGLSTQQLADAVKTLPNLLKTYFDETGLAEVERVTVTVGSSPAATAQALKEGNIDLAFLPAEVFAEEGSETALLADARLLDDGSLRAGTRALICAAPTEYGGQLSGRASGGKPLSRNELGRARWGVLDSASLGGYGCFDLWLADNYQGDRVSGLASVTVYGSYDDLFRAAANGEIDALTIRDDARTDAAEVWTLDNTRTGAGGVRGYGRTESIWDELPVLDVTETLYTTVAAVRPELAENGFAPALERVLQRMSEEQPELMVVLGAQCFAPVTDAELNPTRRLAALG